MGVWTAATEARFATYLEGLSRALGHADRIGPMRDYCAGLLAPLERKSVEPMAAATAPSRTSAQHQSLLHFVGKSPWPDAAILKAARAQVLPAMTRSGPIRAWMIDDTGIPKKGEHSVGVTRQYCGQVGKQENCQTAVTLSIANDDASLPIAHRLYLPEVWASDPTRRAKAGVPAEVVFQTKPEIALEQIRAALDDGVAPGAVLADAAYGNDTSFRETISDLNLLYVVGVQSSISLWPPCAAPLPPKEWSGRGRPPTALRRAPDVKPIAAKRLAMGLDATAWATVTWREGTNAPLVSRFARLRVRPAHRDHKRSEPRPVEWLLVEWPEDADEPTRYWLSTLPEDVDLQEMVDLAKLRWRIERDYQELKQELGLGHYEGRGWRGFHHHATLCIAAYGFLIAERATLPPSAVANDAISTIRRQAPRLPDDHRPRGAPDQNRATCRELDRDPTPAHRRRARKSA